MFEYAIPAEQLVYYIVLAVITILYMALFFRIRFKRDRLALRIVLGVVCYLAVMFMAYIGVMEYFAPVPNRLLFMVIATALLYGFLVDEPVKMIVVSAIILFHMLQFISTIAAFFLVAVDIALVWKILIILAFCAMNITIGWFNFIRGLRKGSVSGKEISAYTIFLSCVRTVITVVLYNLLNYSGTYLDVYGFVCFLAWVEANAILMGSEIKRSFATYYLQMQQLIDEERERQYKAFRDNIEIINVKCHDLKRYTNEIQTHESMDGTPEYIDEITSAINIYDAISNTGNSELDAVLSEKKLHCEKDGILLDYVIDASGLGFMTGFDIYTMFTNALDNAIEACLKEDADRRIISVHIGRRNDFVYICIENYCSSSPVFRDGMPVTSKSDDRYHGYGFISIRNTASKYGGNTECTYDQGYFKVNILMPANQFPAAAGIPAAA